jgi:NTP pyrophosphatase (non-canonical NTP hydrolase)
VKVLAHEDSALEAYFQTRPATPATFPLARAFNQIGEAVCTVVIDGRVTATWEWNPTRRSVHVSLLRGRVSPPMRQTVHEPAKALTATLRQAWAPTHNTTTAQQQPATRPCRDRGIAMRPYDPLLPSQPHLPQLHHGQPMNPLAQGASLADIQDYVAKMEIERGLAGLGIDSQCLKLGEEVGEPYRAVRKTNGDPTDPEGRTVDIAEECVDVMILLMSIANRAGVALEDAFRTKETRNNDRVWQ